MYTTSKQAVSWLLALSERANA